MYKITNQFTNPHLILIRKKLTDGSTTALLVMGHPNRMISSSHNALNKNAVPTEKCSPPSNPQPIEPKSRKFFWTTVGAVILTGAGCVYAKSNQEARNWLASNVPWADKFVGIVYQEKQTYSEFVESQIGRGSEKVSHFIFGKEGRYPIEVPSLANQNIEEDAKKFYAPKNYELPPYRLSPLYEEEEPDAGVPEVEHDALLVETEKAKPPPPHKINVTKEVVELEEQAHINTRLAVDNYKKAYEACQKYNKLLYKIVEGGWEDIDHLDLSASRVAKDERDQAQEAAKNAVGQAREAIEKLETMMNSGEIQAPPDAIVQTKRFIQTFKKDIDKSEKDYKECLAKASLSDKYWHKVQEARQYFKKDLEILYPGLDLNRKTMELQNDSDLLLMHLMNVVQSLNKEIAELQTIRDHKLNRAIECNDQDELTKQKIQDEIQKEKSVLEQEHLRKVLAIQTEANRKLKDSIKKQMQLNQEVLDAAIKKKEAEINKKFKAKACEEVQKTRLEYKQKIAELVGKLKAIEQTLKQRAKSEEEAKKSQALWTAGEALMAATRSREGHVNIADEVNALEKAGKCDECVKAVIGGISKETREKGIMSEKALKESFDQLEKTTTKVALVGREGAGLITYFLSWLQSKLIFKTLAEIPEDELNNKPTDFSQLDTFEIMQRARYYMDQNEVETALKYVNLLRGAPRVAAKSWVDHTRRTLEVRQAAHVIMTHASASGMANA